MKRIVGAMAVVVVAAASLLSVSVHGAGAAEIGTEAPASGDVSFGDVPNVMSATYQIPTRMTFNVGPDERISIKQGQAACAAGQSQYLSTSATQTVETTTISFDVLGFGDSFLCGFEPSTFTMGGFIRWKLAGVDGFRLRPASDAGGLQLGRGMQPSEDPNRRNMYRPH